MSGVLHAVTVLGVLVGVAALFLFAWLDDRERGEDGLPVLDPDPTDWADWQWPADEPDWRWPS